MSNSLSEARYRAKAVLEAHDMGAGVLVDRFITVLRELVAATEPERKCSTHGYGCGLAEATCQPDSDRELCEHGKKINECGADE